MSFSTRLNRLLGRLLPEGMGATEYVPPSKPYQLMADFYLVQFMQAPVGKRGQVLSQRAEELLRDLQYVERQLVPYLREHLLEMAGYAIVRELRHLFDQACPEGEQLPSWPGKLRQRLRYRPEHDELPAGTTYMVYRLDGPSSDFIVELGGYQLQLISGDEDGDADSLQALELDRDDLVRWLLTDYLEQCEVPDVVIQQWLGGDAHLIFNNGAIELDETDNDGIVERLVKPTWELLRGLGVSDKLIAYLEQCVRDEEVPAPGQFDRDDCQQAARAGVYCFDPQHVWWADQYGGPLWQQASQVWLRLDRAHTLPEAAQYIDLLYSLQHNSGALLNKNEGYDDAWLSELLDLKFQMREPEELLPYGSSYMRRLVPQLVRALYGRSLSADYRGKSRRLEPELCGEVLGQIRSMLQRLGYTVSQSATNQLVVFNGGRNFAVVSCDVGKILIRRILPGGGYGIFRSIDIESPQLPEQIVSLVRQFEQAS